MTKRRTIGLGLLGAIFALLLLTASLHNIILGEGRPFSLNLTLPRIGTGASEVVFLPELPTWFSYVMTIMLVMFFIGLIVSPSLRRDLMRNLPIYLLFMLGAYFMYRGASNQQPQNLPSRDLPPAEPPPALAPSTPQVPAFIEHPPEWLISLIVVLIMLMIATVVILVARRLRPRRSEIELIVDEAREALETLRAGGDLRDTITRAYAQMVSLFSEKRGQLRDRALTPREFEQRLAAAGLQDSHIRRLTRLFEMVRYSPYTPGPREEREAEECLVAIVAAYQTRGEVQTQDARV